MKNIEERNEIDIYLDILGYHGDVTDLRGKASFLLKKNEDDHEKAFKEFAEVAKV